MAARRGERNSAVYGGIAGGLVGGLALAVFLMIMAAAAGQDAWAALKGASMPFYGARAVEPGFAAGPVLLAVLVHFAVSVIWGILFGLAAFGLQRGPTLAAGVLWGFVVWMGMYYLVLPAIGLGGAATATPVELAVLSHLLFGFFVAVGFVPYQRPRPPDRPVQRSTPGGRDIETQPPPPPA
jgi:hypothetical protein